MEPDQKSQPLDYDFIVVGSGFGGSVSALRLSEKGYRVAVLERGKRFEDKDFPKTNWDLKRYLWAPILRCFGIQRIHFFRDIMVLSGSGVGGGSLVYANTLLEPENSFYESPVWKGLADWKNELAPHFATAKRMLGVTTYPKLTISDRLLKECAEDMGQAATFKPTEVGIYFGEPGKTVADPYFGGEGPDRTGCHHCGGCMVGCRHGAKNTLVKNYLYFAEKKGAEIIPETEVISIEPTPSYYRLITRRSTAWPWNQSTQVLTSKKVILAAGVIGTMRLLLRCKYVTKTLSNLSNRLGAFVRTNSEAILGVSEFNPPPLRDYSEGAAITSIFQADANTSIEPVRYPKGSNFMRLLTVPMVDGTNPVLRAIKLLWTIVRHPFQALRLSILSDWSSKTVILLVMQTLDNHMRFGLGRSVFTFFRKDIVSIPTPESPKVPTYIPIAHEVARRLAKKVGGVPQNAVNEALLDMSTTAHILGGAAIGRNQNLGVIDSKQEVFGYLGLYVCDGSAIPDNLGVNPSLTITAMTERAMSLIPEKSF